jgi:hypothetical protein
MRGTAQGADPIKLRGKDGKFHLATDYTDKPETNNEKSKYLAPTTTRNRADEL